MSVIDTAELVERVWARDATLWTGSDEGRWLGWLDEPGRMEERIPDLELFASSVFESGVTDVVLLGMGGSSLAPEVFRRAFGVERFRVLDTTHPSAIRALEQALDLDRTLFVVASKSGTTIETRAHLDYFWERTGASGDRFVAITDPGTDLERLARERDFRAVFPGETTIGGRYSALSVFGLVPAALMGIDLERVLVRAQEMAEGCRGDEGNPGLELGLRLGNGWREGRDKLVLERNPSGFGLWVEQLVAESTGKQGRGIVPAPDDPSRGADVQVEEVRLDDPYELGQEFYRWEFGTAVAGAVIGVNCFDQPNVQEAKDRTAEILAGGEEPALEPEGSLGDLLGEAREQGRGLTRPYVAVLAFVDPAHGGKLDGLVERVREETGCVVTTGLGPRYLHSTGQLHKGGPANGFFVQVVDDLGHELAIPGRPFGFRRLIAAQAAGDYEALKERGRRVVRVRFEEVA